MPEAVGFIGLGAMGGPMARRLLDVADLVVHDIDERAVRSLAEGGARPAGSPKAVADEAGIVCICLPDLKVAEVVIFGPDGLTGGSALKQVVDLSTTGAAFAQATSERLAGHGIDFVSAPVSGGLAGARSGALTVMASGPPDAVGRMGPYFARLGQKVFDLGSSPGSAQTMKLLNNVLSSTAFAVTCEAMIVGTKAGLDPDQMIEVFNTSTGRNNATLGKLPKAILPRTFDYGAKTSISAKDCELCISEADALGFSMSVAKAVQKLWQARLADGAADTDSSTLILPMERESGVVVRGRTAAS